jgi:undecaprenyl-diphosphatase
MITNPQQIFILGRRFRHIEIHLFRFINNKMHCTFLNFCMKTFTQIGSAFFAVAILFFILIQNKPGGSELFFYLLGSLIIGQMFVHPVKWLVNRPRPCLALSEARVLRALNNNNSFPSGHTCAAISMALVLSQSFPGAALLLFTLAVMVGISRIYLGVHYPTDVIAGGAIGYFSFSIAPYIYVPVVAFISSQAAV